MKLPDDRVIAFDERGHGKSSKSPDPITEDDRPVRSRTSVDEAPRISD